MLVFYGKDHPIPRTKEEFERLPRIPSLRTLRTLFMLASVGKGLRFEDISIRYYGRDDRLHHEVFKLVFDSEDFIKKHGSPQFLCYMVEEESDG